jgi:hypothetical protein
MMSEIEQLNQITESIIGAAIEAHKSLGPGLLESAFLKISGLQVGLLINFNVKILKNGLVRIVNNFPESQQTLRTLRLNNRS